MDMVKLKVNLHSTFGLQNQNDSENTLHFANRFGLHHGGWACDGFVPPKSSITAWVDLSNGHCTDYCTKAIETRNLSCEHKHVLQCIFHHFSLHPLCGTLKTHQKVTQPSNAAMLASRGWCSGPLAEKRLHLRFFKKRV